MMTDDFDFLRGKLLSARVYPETLPLDPTWRVVNLGSGEGPQAIIYAGQYRQMLGVDINPARLEKSQQAMHHYNVEHYHTVCANVEQVPLPSGSFDAAIAIDIIEHVENPRGLCREVYRLLKPGGRFLVTFPTQHDRFRERVSAVAQALGRRPRRETVTAGWNPDAHNQAYPLDDWLALVSECGFTLSHARATTLFPPLHQYGLPRFWFSIDAIHAVDRWLCQQPGLKRYGQAVAAVFTRD